MEIILIVILSLIIVILLTLGFILLKQRGKLSYLGALSLIILIGLPDLYYVPIDYDDLYRYFYEMNIVKSVSNIHSLFIAYKYIPYLQHHELNYIYDIFQWLIARSNNYELLPFLSAVLIYFCISAPFIHQIITKEGHTKELFIGLLCTISLFPYYTVSSTVRWNLASGIFFLLMYISYNCDYHKRLLTLPLYLIPLFIHQGMILPIIIIIFALCIGNHKIHWYIYLIIILLFIIIIYLLSNDSSAENGSLVSNFQFYNAVDVSKFLGSSYARLAYWFSFVTPYVYAILLFINKKSNRYMVINSLILCILFDLALLFDPVIADRYALDIGLLSMVMYLKRNKYFIPINQKSKSLYLLIAAAGILIILFSIIFKMHFNFSQINFNGNFTSLLGDD